MRHFIFVFILFFSLAIVAGGCIIIPVPMGSESVSARYYGSPQYQARRAVVCHMQHGKFECDVLTSWEKAQQRRYRKTQKKGGRYWNYFFSSRSPSWRAGVAPSPLLLLTHTPLWVSTHKDGMSVWKRLATRSTMRCGMITTATSKLSWRRHENKKSEKAKSANHKEGAFYIFKQNTSYVILSFTSWSRMDPISISQVIHNKIKHWFFFFFKFVIPNLTGDPVWINVSGF